MTVQEVLYKPANVTRCSSIFSTKEDGLMETHSIFTLAHEKEDEYSDFESQLNRIKEAFSQWKAEKKESQTVLLRFFLSDAANQASFIRKEDFCNCAISIVQQPSLDQKSKIMLWSYDIENVNINNTNSLYAVSHNGYTHYWTGNQYINQGDSEYQTRQLLEQYVENLRKEGVSFTEDCIRTWFFVQDIDSNYRGVVVGRRDYFEEIGLTPSTHYITSTGIEGKGSETEAKVLFDAYSVKGLQKKQQQYLYAKDFLNPTHEYGVTFERGVKVKYGDRDHLYISGTASINNKGEVVHVGDIRKQTLRMLENVNELLKEGDASPEDTAVAIVYLRDLTDYNTVKNIFNKSNFNKTPKVFVLAPVCRPTWLIEMECIAIRPSYDKEYRNF